MGRVMSAAISESAPKEIFRVLQELQIKCRKTMQNKFLPKETKGHADMLLMVPKKSILVMDFTARTLKNRP